MTQATNTAQQKIHDNPEIDLPTALAVAGRRLGELLEGSTSLVLTLNQIMGSEAALNLAGRLALALQAAWIVPGAQTDHAGIAAMFGMGSKEGARSLTDRLQTPWDKPGESRLYQTADIAKDFRPKDEPPPPANPETPAKKPSKKAS